MSGYIHGLVQVELSFLVQHRVWAVDRGDIRGAGMSQGTQSAPYFNQHPRDQLCASQDSSSSSSASMCISWYFIILLGSSLPCQPCHSGWASEFTHLPTMHNTIPGKSEVGIHPIL